MNGSRLAAERRRRLRTRAIPLAVVAFAAFAAGVAAGTRTPAEVAVVDRFAAAWAAEDFAGMYAELTPAARARTSLSDLTAAYLEAEATATVRDIVFDPAPDPTERDGRTVVELAVEVGTVAFGRLRGELALPVSAEGIAWSPQLVFPGLRRDEQLGSRIRLAGRAAILARDGTPLATGPATARRSPLGAAAIDVAGEVGPADPAVGIELARQGFPEGTPVGVSGLEQAFNTRLAGKPGGELLAVGADGGGARVLARGEPRRGRNVRTTIDPELQETSVSALAGRAGGVAVLDARSGAVRALAGTAFSGPQPPGSTFKIVTTVAALEEGAVTLEEEFPVVTGTNVGGRFVSNAHGEYCGGTFVESFAHSCNSVFAPLGVEVGEDKLVNTAERFGWNEVPTLYSEAATAIVEPPAPTIPQDPGDDLDLGVSAIGQGEVLATPLNMASVAQAVAARGIRMPTPVVANPELQSDAGPVRVTSRSVARRLRDLMVAVVESGTGTAAALPGIAVAGKTGTAELGPKPGAAPPAPGLPPEQIVDAWFTAFAPARSPRLAVAVMLIDADADGGTVAAPVAQQVLAAGLTG